MKYNVFYDPWDITGDCVCIKNIEGKEIYYGFHFVNDKLFLYKEKTYDEPVSSDYYDFEKVPFVVLKKI